MFRLSAALPLLVLAATLPALAQSDATAPVQPAVAGAPLLPPAGLYYQYWPMQLVQFVGPELPYSMIVLYVNDRAKEPMYDATLTERAGGKRIHYVNQPALVAEDKAKGEDAYLTRMQLDGPSTPAKAAQYLLRFNTEKGVPVLWQFVQLTDASDQGSGLSPIDAPIPILLFREQGALAGEGTALKIGDVTSSADVWKEYAQPPYFVPYHGALSTGVHILSMAPAHSVWSGTQPGTLAEGASWKLTSAAGTTLDAHLESLKGSAATVRLISGLHDTAITLDAQQGAAGWSVSRVRCGPADAKAEHMLTLNFSPALTPGTESRLDILAGKKTKLAAGSVRTAAGEDGATIETWLLSSPDSLKGKTAAATTNLQH